jgi:tetratricopeptide (TPR) repeat protein
MPEHTIPDSLIQNIRSGRAALVVGAGLGIPSWKQLLEHLNEALRSRGGDQDEAAAKDVDKLLHKGSLVRAAGFLARALGPEICDQHVAELWSTPDPLPEVARAIGRLPFRQVWTTFPGPILELAMAEVLPESWRAPTVVTYQQAGEIDRRRTLLKVLGDLDSFAVTPMSVRQRLASARDLFEHVRPFYTEGTLLFIGFRYGDPDLAALLDRLFGAFEPPRNEKNQHFMIASGVGPVTVDELASEHHIQLINLPGRGADDTATAELLSLLSALEDRCVEAGITLATTQPDADDLEGWLELAAEHPDDADARAAIDGIEARAINNEDWDRLIEILMGQVEIEPAASGRAALLRRVAEVFEERIGDLPRAFTALTAAVVEDPSDTTSVDEAERLADDADGWTELVTDVSSIADQIEAKTVAAEYWYRLGRWYHTKLDHPEYAIASYRQALKRDAERPEIHSGLAAVYRHQQRWPELAEVLEAEVALELDGERKLALYIELGELYENQLASVSKALEAFEQAAELDATSDSALASMERLFRREERWGKLAGVLERRAELFEQAGESGRATNARRELANLRAEKLGDLEGAIARCESTIESSPDDVETLRKLEELYEKTGRTADYLGTLERLAEVLAGSERIAVWRRLAAELEDRPESRDRAIDAYRRILEIEPNALDAHRSLGRLLEAEGRTGELAEAIEAQIAIVTEADGRADLYVRLGRMSEGAGELDRAIEAHLNALAQVADNAEALRALARLYVETDSIERAVDVLIQHANIAGDQGAPMWASAGQLAAESLDDFDLAERYLEKALEIDPAQTGALIALADLHARRGSWASAVSRLAEAARTSANRLERVELLGRAAEIAATRLEEPAQALELSLDVLEIDPEHRESGLRASRGLIAAGRLDEALPVLEMLARTTADGDWREHARWEAELGRVAAELGHRQKAAKHFRRAVEADPENREAALGLADSLFAEASEVPTDDKWAELEKIYRDLLIRHSAHIEATQVAEAWYRVALSLRARDEAAKARDAINRALERAPTFMPALAVRVEMATEASDWARVASAKEAMVEVTPLEVDKVALLEELGDLYAGELGNSMKALERYRAAVALRPDSHKLLHKILDIHSERKDWTAAIETLSAIVATAKDPVRRSKYHYAAAVIGRDELRNREVAVEHFGKALDEDPGNAKAFSGIETLLAQEGRYKELARAYRKRLKQVTDLPDEGLKLWTKLGEICADHLDDTESAIAAFEVAASLDPDNIERHEQLANLYLEAGEDHRQSAIDELHILLKASPGRVELFRALSGLYRAIGNTDRAFLCAQALVFLGAASESERELYTHLRPKTFVPAKRKLTEELWQKSIIHPAESRHVNVIFQQVIGALASTTAQPPSAFHLGAGEQVASNELLAAKVIRYGADVLGLEREPLLFVRPELDGFKVANTALSGKLTPSVLIGGEPLRSDDERQLAFEAGKRLSYLRPDRYINYALGSLPKLESAFSAALAASGIGGGQAGDEVDRFAVAIRKSVPSAVLDQVAAVARKMPGDPKNGLIANWQSATDLTANRVGFILANDLEIAARNVATEAGGLSVMPVKERLRELLAYSVSEEYFAVRKHLGLSVSRARA